MKIGLIGYGSIGARHTRNLIALRQDVTVLTKRRDVEASSVVHDWRTFVKAGPYNAIVVANETASHAATLRRVLALNPRAVFVEKPLSHTVKSVKDIVTAYHRARVSLWVGYNFQFFRPFLRIKKIIASRQLGKIYAMRAFVGQDLRGWRKRDYRKGYSASKTAGGGVLLDLVHDINYPAWLLGEPLRAKASVVKKVSSLQISTEDIAESILVSASGVIVSVHQDYLRIPGRRSFEIVAEKGSLLWDSESDQMTVAGANGKKHIEHLPVDRNVMYVNEMRAFLSRVRSNAYVTNGDEAVRDLAEIEQIKRLAKTSL